MPVPVAPTAAVLGQPASAGAQFNALATRAGYLIGGYPLFIGRQATVQSIPSGVWTAVTLDAHDIDRDAGHSLTVNNSRYVSQTAGWYEIQSAGSFANATSGRRVIRLQNGGGTVPGSGAGGPPPSSTQALTLQTTALFYIAVGDYMELAMYQDSGAAISTSVNGQELSRLVCRWVST